MIETIIRWSLANRFFVLLATLILIGAGLFSEEKIFYYPLFAGPYCEAEPSPRLLV